MSLSHVAFDEEENFPITIYPKRSSDKFQNYKIIKRLNPLTSK